MSLGEARPVKFSVCDGEYAGGRHERVDAASVEVGEPAWV
jgi:hypothetical protein